MSKGYKIWPTANGYTVVDRETMEEVHPSIDKRAAMRIAFDYSVNGLPVKAAPVKEVVKEEEPEEGKKVGRPKKSGK
jgi:hypothetical protein